MKKNIFNNKITIITFLVLLAWSLFEIIANVFYGPYLFEYKDPIIVFFTLNRLESLWFIQIFAPIFVIIPAIWNFHRNLNSGYIKNCLIREDYKKYMIKNYFEALISGRTIIMFWIYQLIISCVIAGNINFGSQPELYGYFASPAPQFYPVLGLYMMIFFIVIILHCIFYVNLGLIFCKKNKNIFITIILAYLSFIISEIIFNVFIGSFLLSNLLNLKEAFYITSLFNIWIFHGVQHLSYMIIFAILLVIISTVAVYFIYRNKEEVLIEVEK